MNFVPPELFVFNMIPQNFFFVKGFVVKKINFFQKINIAYKNIVPIPSSESISIKIECCILPSMI